MRTATNTFENFDTPFPIQVAEPAPAPQVWAQTREADFHQFWELKASGLFNFYSKDGRRVKVLHPGTRNLQQGPDFLEAEIVLGGEQLVGSIEIHRFSGEWYQHDHHHDPLYDSVILHMVYQSKGKATLTSTGRVVPELELHPHFSLPQAQVFPCRMIPQSEILKVLDVLGTKRRKAKAAHWRFLVAQHGPETALLAGLGRYLFQGSVPEHAEQLMLKYPFSFWKGLGQQLGLTETLEIFRNALSGKTGKTRVVLITKLHPVTRNHGRPANKLDQRAHQFSEILKQMLTSQSDWREWLNHWEKNLTLAGVGQVRRSTLFINLFSVMAGTLQPFRLILEPSHKTRWVEKKINLRLPLSPTSHQGAIALYDQCCSVSDCETCPITKWNRTPSS